MDVTSVAALIGETVGVFALVGGLWKVGHLIFKLGVENANQVRETAKLEILVSKLAGLEEVARALPHVERRVEQLEDVASQTTMKVHALERWRERQEGRRESRGDFG